MIMKFANVVLGDAITGYRLAWKVFMKLCPDMITRALEKPVCFNHPDTFASVLVKFKCTRNIRRCHIQVIDEILVAKDIAYINHCWMRERTRKAYD